MKFLKKLLTTVLGCSRVFAILFVFSALPGFAQEKVIPAIEDEVEVQEEDFSVPFTVIEEVPIFPGCEEAGNTKTCFEKMIQQHIRKNFRYPETAQEMGIQGKVNIIFVIQKDGSIGNIKMRGPHKSLEQEALRIIQQLPKMIPGKKKGKPVEAPFSISIAFKLDKA